MKGKRKNNNDESALPPTIKTKKGRRNKQPEGGPSTSGEQVRLIDYSLLIYLHSKSFSQIQFHFV
jgi:hypothetical protein